jgi:anti-anti-sigma factor
MDLTDSTRGKWTVITVSGRIDATTAPRLDAALQDAIRAGRMWLALDLAGAPYLSSAGLRVFLSALKAVQAGGGGMALAGLPDPVREVLEVAGFLTILPVVAGLPDLEP